MSFAMGFPVPKKDGNHSRHSANFAADGGRGFSGRRKILDTGLAHLHRFGALFSSHFHSDSGDDAESLAFG
jgi:hypothetical protein